MPLIDLKTDLKSLTYGKDRPGGGSSKEPFITEPIPEGETPGASNDFLLRQGAIGRGVEDVSRLTKLLFSTTKGLSFTTTTNLLSRTSVKTEASTGPAYAAGTINQGVYVPSSTLAQVAAGFTGTHLNLLGLDPTSPMAGIVEGGLFPGGGLIRYEQVVRDLNNQEGDSSNNRLVSLYDTKISGLTPTPKNSLVASSPLNILSYGGGPGSILGVGKTIIKRATYTTGKNEYGWTTGSFLDNSFNKVSAAKTYFNDNYSSKEQEINTPLGPITLKGIEVGTYNSEANFPKGVVNSGSIVTLKTAYINPDKTPITYNPNASGEFITLTSYTQRSYQSNPDFILRKYGNLSSPASGSKQYTYTGDKFSATNTNLLNVSTGSTVEALGKSQLFKFYLNLLNPENPSNNEYLYWQAYVEDFSDSIGAQYDEYTYTGRGYPSYKYKGFSRAISLDFTIVAENQNQIVPIYTKLNKLIQNMAPNYSNSGYIRGNFVRLTFGDYLNDVPGIVKGFTLSPIFEAGFDIGTGENSSTKQLPKAITVSGFNFIPITDNNNQLVSSNSTFISY
jgi:hypothetical protein